MVCIHHIFFIHSSLRGHLGCFHTLAIVKKKKKRRGGMLLWKLECINLLELMFLFLSNIYPGVEWLPLIKVLFFPTYITVLKWQIMKLENRWKVTRGWEEYREEVGVSTRDPCGDETVCILTKSTFRLWFERCYHGGKLAKRYMGSLWIIYYNSMK